MRRNLLVISHVLPFPGSAGQQQRVAYTLRAAAREFEVSFLTFAGWRRRKEVIDGLREFSVDPIVLTSRTDRSLAARALQKILAGGYSLATGLRSSNYVIGHLELGQERLRRAIDPSRFDCVLYEYIHASPSVPLFGSARVPSVVDTHNVLWRARDNELRDTRFLPASFKRYQVRRYRRAEERAWRVFDGLIAINRAEQQAISANATAAQEVFYAPMGVDLGRWPYSWKPAAPPRLAYYGGMGSSHNQKAALRCIEQIMPRVWDSVPNAEFWLVGSNPPERLRKIAQPPKLNVTGFVPDAQSVLKSMSIVVCPWEGNYGFRSRVVETMALGIPMVATPEAVDGMELEAGMGILFGRTDSDLSAAILKLLADPVELARQSRVARQEIEKLYSFENTYVRLVEELREWLEARKQV